MRPRRNVPVVMTTHVRRSVALERFDAEHTTAARVEHAAARPCPESSAASLLLEQRSDRAPVEPAVALRARRPHRRALAAIQHAELKHGEIGRAAHDAAERIDFAHDGALGDAADRRIARHLPDRLERARDNPTRAPSRAAATAASVPACPAPTTMTSKSVSKSEQGRHTFKDKYRPWMHP